jgi:transposase
VEPRCAGIDVSKKELVVAVSGEAAQRTFANDAAGHRQLVQWLTRRGRSARVCLEATGIYHLDVALALHRAPRIAVSVVNPASSSHFARVLLKRAKTDGVDASVLLAYAERMPFVAWQPPRQAVLDLRAIVRRMGALIEARTQEKNRLHAAGHSEALPVAVAEDIAAHLAQLDARLEVLQAQALDVLASDVELKELFGLFCTAPGFATRSALRTLAELAVLPADMDVRQKVAHAGLDPRPLESGSSVRRPTRISKTGNAHLRAALYMPALVAVQHDPHVRAFYEQRIAGGLKPIAALVAVERKLLHALHGMAKHRTPWHGSKFRALRT